MKSFFKIVTQDIVVVLLILGIVVGLNILSSRFPNRLDLTDEQEYTLSSSTLKVIDRLEDRLTIKLYYSKDLPNLLLPVKQRVSDLIDEFKAHAKKEIVVEYVEPDLNEEKEREAIALGIVPLELNVIEKDKREVKRAFMGMALYYQDKKEVIPVVAQVQNLEYILDLNLIKLTQKTSPKIGVYQGGDSKNYKLIPQVVEQIGQVVEIKKDDTNLEEKDLNALMILDPSEVSKTALQEWDKLLNQGINILLFVGNISVTDAMKVESVSTGLDDWLAGKGIAISDEILLDPKQNAQAGFMSGFMRVYMAYPFWAKALKGQLNQDNPITSRLEEILFPWSNVVQVLDENHKDWESIELVRSSNYSFLQPEGEQNISPEYINTMTTMPVMEPFPLSVVLKNKSQPKSGKIFVTATPHIVQDRFLQQSRSNVIFLSNMLEYSAWGDYLIGIRSRGKTARPLADVTQTQKSLIKWGLIVGVPFFAILSGLLVLFVLKKRRETLISHLSV